MANIFRDLTRKFNSYRRIPVSVTDLYFKVKTYLPRNPSILEAGAHKGYDTYGLAKIWPAGRIYAFEPVPALFAHLVRRAGTLRNVRLYNLALGNTNGNLEMHVSGGSSTGSSSLLSPSDHVKKFPGVTFEHRILVPVRRLIDWAREENVASIDMLWLDMQGFEVYALQGAGPLLGKTKVIYTELCPNELYEGMITQDAYIEFLSTSGFDLVSLSGDGEINDGIFVRRKE